MKKLPIAAAALLLSTSAYAMIPSGNPTDGTMQEDPYMVETTTAMTPAYDEAPALQPAAVDTWTTYTPTDPALKPVTATSGDVKAAEWAKADAKFDAATETDWDAAAKAKMDSAALDDSAKLQPATYETRFGSDDSAPAFQPASMESGFVTDDGATEAAEMSAADETVKTASTDLTPRQAAGNYPACHPGPGDDRCIQLYEPGVRAELASWSQPTGGFADSSDTQVAMGGSTEELNQQALADSNRALQMASAAADTTAGTEVAMGGPYEPVADDAGMNGDGTVDTALGETAQDEIEV
jgi:hypothetical protein